MRYQANLRRKAGSKLAAGVWSALDTKIAAAANSEKKEFPHTKELMAPVSSQPFVLRYPQYPLTNNLKELAELL